jgi:hypothetical protein
MFEVNDLVQITDPGNEYCGSYAKIVKTRQKGMFGYEYDLCTIIGDHYTYCDRWGIEKVEELPTPNINRVYEQICGLMFQLKDLTQEVEDLKYQLKDLEREKER